ncbi:protoporphyrinogen/coproporphyrinogen oxidase [Pseudobdellovibrio exovorus]|uniref:Amine oxidase domain-containing protein n=1 Tax=Pseudobdellovibrio exovorus JSS TaxID=1184267 RepID=M4VCX0_9BACT|nr:FAD-dependent oxidoreductase [Pseudobdellovibrio exovorus]AGH95886.1 hypothetical protein A11Q_1670 [Pseudobdellovibrio exovorus JSS]
MSETKAPPSVAIIGSGFSGMTLAWALSKQGISCEIFESSSRSGGLIFTDRKEAILAESAANALLSNQHVETLFQDLGLKPLVAGFRSNKRWIFRNKPQRLPLTLLEIVQSASRLLKAKLTNKLHPFADETVADWGIRCFGHSFTQNLLTPALQGIYGVGAAHLSADLVIGGVLKPQIKIPKGQLRGSISSENGLYTVIESLEKYLKLQRVVFHYQQQVEISDLQKKFAAVVVATSYLNSSQLLKSVAPQLSESLAQVPAVGLDVVVMGFKKEKPLQGFGCLFPREQGFNSLGVLFNTDIFAGRGSLQSESWIVPHQASPALTEDELVQHVLSDRKQMLQYHDEPEFKKVTRWPKALPLYGFELKKVLNSDLLKNRMRVSEAKSPVYLTGNYLGAIGLGKILGRNLKLADVIREEIAE